jgi:hypothetical protein
MMTASAWRIGPMIGGASALDAAQAAALRHAALCNSARVWRSAAPAAAKSNLTRGQDAAMPRCPSRKAIVLAAVALFASWGCRAADLTLTERRWLQGAWPVIAFAKEARMPLDVVVQPQDTPGLPPLALAFVDGRCKLVLSMRGNAAAQATLDELDPELADAALELMAAHELGHCQRYLDGAWHGLPAGFALRVPESLSPELRDEYAQMRAARREEGYGDLVGLAWTQAHRPQQYARVHAWLQAERSKDLITGSHHDTLVWLRLAAQGNALADPSIFDGAARLWRAGLAADAK